jgi:hypothetical protein
MAQGARGGIRAVDAVENLRSTVARYESAYGLSAFE